MNNDTLLTDNWQRCQLLLGLLANRQPQTSHCPDDAQLAAFIANELKPAQAQQILRHLNHCHECYEVWQMSESVMQELPLPVVVRQNAHKIPWWKKLSAQLMTWQPYHLGVVFSILLLVIVLPKILHPVDNPVYQQLKPHQAALATVLSQQNYLLTASQDNPPLGFSPSQADSLNHQAFLAGVAIGQQRLLNKSIANNPDLPATYQQLGEWSVLLWTVCQLPSDVEETFWRQQQYSGEQLLEALKTDDHIVQLLQDIQKLVIKLPQKEQPKLYETLSRQLQQLAMVID